ncbi:MAG: class I SAM-dependent methyltransferase [Nitrososphaera sp.]|uniref:class I SAM-dependent methyltransferase n=1 Tax=Nitrososphaera sp. TaxID=1971748 RepID=UPI003D6F3B6D
MAGWKGRPKEFKQLWDYSVGFYGVWVAHIGRSVGLLQHIAHSPASAAGLAAKLGLDAGAVGAWCSAAVALGLIGERKGKLRMSARMKEILLDAKSPNYLGGQFSYLAMRSLEYRGLEDLFNSGKTLDMSSTFDAIEQATDWDHNAFLSAIKKGRSRRLHAMLSKGCRVLDVGCGTGTLIEKLWRSYPRSAFVGVEPSEVAVHRAMEVAAGKPVEILRLQGEAMNFDGQFDIVYLGESLYAASDKQAVVSNCYRALKKGGAIAIVEGLLPKTASKEGRLIIGMQLDFALQGYRFMTKEETGALLRNAGFSKVAFSDFGGSLFLVSAWKI